MVAIGVVFGREAVNLGVLVEIVGGVGFALGNGAIADVVVGVRNGVGGGEFVADVVAVVLVVLENAAAEQVVGVDVGGVGVVRDGGEEVTVGFVTPCDDSLIGIDQLRLEVGACEVVPRKAVGFGDAARDGVIGDGLLAVAIHAIADIAAEGGVMADGGLVIQQLYSLLGLLIHKLTLFQGRV